MFIAEPMTGNWIAPGNFGDLEAPGAFDRALQARSAGGEVILTVTDWRHQRWAHNLLLNLEQLDLHHHLVLAAEPLVCHALVMRMAGAVGCGHSSWLRGGANATIDAGLYAYHIQEGHVYHIWWQRWHYLARAVALGYRALSLDSDMSLRVSPYPILRGPMRSHQLVVAIDSARSGKQLSRFFPAINVGFVYARGGAAGAAHRILAEVAARFEQLLCGRHIPLPDSSKKLWQAPQQVLWEQDTFADVVETAAYTLRGRHAFRHVLSHVARNRTWEDAARVRDWTRQDVAWSGVAPEGSLLAEQVSLALNLPARAGSAAGESAAVGRPVHGGAVREGEAATVGGLPKWYLAAYASCPYGNSCDGRWARTPTPVGVAHMVGERGKFTLIRTFGWWDYRVDRHHFVSNRLPSAAAAARPPRRRVYPRSVRVLLLRGLGVRLGCGPQDAGRISAMRYYQLIARWALTALALGRRLVLPYVQCGLARRQETSLRSRMTGVAAVYKLDDQALCGSARSGKGSHPHSDNNWTVPRATPHARPSPSLDPTPVPTTDGDGKVGGAAEGATDAGTQSSDASWGEVGRKKLQGCCNLVPLKCIDEFGTRRMLHDELILLERDFAHLQAEAAQAPHTKDAAAASIATAASTAATRTETSTNTTDTTDTTDDAFDEADGADLAAINQRFVVAIAPLAGNATLGVDVLLRALLGANRVAVADLHGIVNPLDVMPPARALARAARKASAFIELSRRLTHARGCVKALGGADELVAEILKGRKY